MKRLEKLNFEQLGEIDLACIQGGNFELSDLEMDGIMSQYDSSQLAVASRKNDVGPSRKMDQGPSLKLDPGFPSSKYFSDAEQLSLIEFTLYDEQTSVPFYGI